MIEPIENILKLTITPNGNTYLVKPGSNFRNIFPKDTHPVLFNRHRAYLGFLNDSQASTIYQVTSLNPKSEWTNKVIRLRMLSREGTQRVESWLRPMCYDLIARLNDKMGKVHAKFKENLKELNLVEAEKDVAEARRLFGGITTPYFSHEYFPISETSKIELSLSPTTMAQELRPEIYGRAVRHYLQQAQKAGNEGWQSGVTNSCNNARYCAKKSLKDQYLKKTMGEIEEIEKESTKIAEEIEKDKKIVSRFSYRRPNTRESRLAFELGFDPFLEPTKKDYEEIDAAKRRLKERGIDF